ncbi:hypothetical protein [Actomonas aquatica]|uniref:DUF1737 domain-containing protein n=1 Tax=Actomonas aquatica TaxID=2866162 RepID=A0ABZ1C8B2_9BACT|nr:hypothetical protein [Opitutus sp. WL0086]WRQ87706.1 hypothetical protein K1X11_023085 [Opitutus sp. WL0086]
MDTYTVIAVTMGLSFKKAVDELNAQVNQAITRGWRPAGGVAVAGTRLMQAMTKER